MNYYLILGVGEDADPEAIRRAFRTLVRRYHPDAGAGSSAERFREIVTAYETLSDPVRRSRYDRELRGIPVSSPAAVEPLSPTVWVEPIAGGRRAPFSRWPHQAPQPITIDDMMDELFRAMDAALFGGVRTRRW